jgi:diadenylate cyclase
LVDLFKIGFLTVKLIDIIDILIIAYVFYKLYRLMKGTIAFQIFVALILIIGFSFVAQLLNMQAVGWLLSKLTDVWVIAFVILFQPEIRRVLLIVGRTNIVRLFLKINVSENIEEVADACVKLQDKGWGALIVITRTTGIPNIIENGIALQSKITTELLLSIFNPRSPLHDGAVILSTNRIEAAKCVLPLAEVDSAEKKYLGTRHRAGLGISEVSDAVAVIVSEERKVISIAEEGNLYVCKNVNDLKEKLKYAMSNVGVAKSVLKIFETPVKKEGTE